MPPFILPKMKPYRLPTYLAAATTTALASHAQSLVITQIADSQTYDAAYTNGSDRVSNQTLGVGNSISDLGVSAWAYGSYSSAGSSGTNYNQAQALTYVEATASGGDAFGRMAVTMEFTDFEDIWRPGTTLWYSNTIEGGNITASSFKSGIYYESSSQSLRVMDGDQVTLGIEARDTTYNNNTTGIGHGATFRIVNAPDVTISGGTASWSVLDNSAADTDLTDGVAMIDRNGGVLALDYLLQDLDAARGRIANFVTPNLSSPFRDDVEVTLQLMITGTNAEGVTDTFLLGSTDASTTFGADVTWASHTFDAVDGTALFDPTAWADGDFTLTFDVAINQLAYGHGNSYLDALLLGSLSASQSFTLFTGAGASAVPEPSSYALLLGLGALGLGLRQRRPIRSANLAPKP